MLIFPLRIGLHKVLPLVLGTLVFILSTVSHAEEVPTIRIAAGETLEITTDPVTTTSEFSWILTKDRKFLQAQRTRFFQTRIADPGVYVLDVSIQNSQTKENTYRAFSVVVTDPTGEISGSIGSRDAALSASIRAEPNGVNGRSFLPIQGGIVKIFGSSSSGKIDRYVLDLDTSVDTNGNGDPVDDADNQDTLSEKTGSPIYIFLLPKAQERTIRLTVNDLSLPEPSFSDLSISFGATQEGMGTGGIENTESPIRASVDGLRVRFEADMESPGRQLLFEWDFGDKTKSLLNTPIHNYASGGKYAVSLRVRDIQNGEEIFAGTETLELKGETQESSSSSGTQESSLSSSRSASESSENAGLVGRILKVALILIFLLAIAIGLYVGMVWIKRRTTSSIQQTLEKVEKSMISKSLQEPAEIVEPMKLKKEKQNSTQTDKPALERIVDREKEATEFKSRERSHETPTAEAGPVPSWLAKASSTKTEVQPKKTEPPQKPLPPTERKEMPAEPKVGLPAEPKPQPKTEGPTPDWLKPKASAPTADAPVVPQKAPVPTKANSAAPPSSALEIEQPEPKPAENASVPTPAPTRTETGSKTITAIPDKKTEEVQAQNLVEKSADIASPAEPNTPVTEKTPEDEEPPIAIIQADSISK